MLGKTSISAIRALIFLAEQDREACLSPRRIADVIGESPTYLAKVLRLLVKEGILRAEKGVKGGVRLDLPPASVSLLSVVEACQGTIVGDYCRSGAPESSFCNFHRAALELHQAITGVLGRWTLADLAMAPRAAGNGADGIHCVMTGGASARSPELVLPVNVQPELERRLR